MLIYIKYQDMWSGVVWGAPSELGSKGGLRAFAIALVDVVVKHRVRGDQATRVDSSYRGCANRKK
jgi:hypothetical protein